MRETERRQDREERKKRWLQRDDTREFFIEPLENGVVANTEKLISVSMAGRSDTNPSAIAGIVSAYRALLGDASS